MILSNSSFSSSGELISPSSQGERNLSIIILYFGPGEIPICLSSQPVVNALTLRHFVIYESRTSAMERSPCNLTINIDVNDLPLRVETASEGLACSETLRSFLIAFKSNKTFLLDFGNFNRSHTSIR